MVTKTGRGASIVTGSVNEIEQKKQLQRADAATRLLENDTLMQALKNMRENALNNLIKTGLKDKDTREELYMLTKSIDSLEAELKVFITIGSTARLKLGG